MRLFLISLLVLLPFAAIAQTEEAQSWYWLAIDYRDSAQTNEDLLKGLEFISTAIETDGSYADAYLLRSWFYNELLEPEKAGEDLKMYLQLSNTPDPTSYRQLALIEEKKFDYDAAIHYLGMAISIAATNKQFFTEAYLDQARVNIRRGQLQSACATWQSVHRHYRTNNLPPDDLIRETMHYIERSCRRDDY